LLGNTVEKNEVTKHEVEKHDNDSDISVEHTIQNNDNDTSSEECDIMMSLEKIYNNTEKK